MRTAIAIGALFAATFFGACREAETDASTPEGLVQQLEQALSRDGQVYHARIESTLQQPGAEPQPMASYELWLDLPHERYHLAFTKPPGWEADVPDHYIEIGTDGRSYMAADGDKAREIGERAFPACLPLDAPNIVARLACGFMKVGSEGATGKVEQGGQYRGHEATELAITKPAPPGDGKSGTMTFRLAVDAKTFAPLGTMMAVDQAGQEMGRAETVIEGEFVAANSLDAGFFSPAAIGYVSPADELTQTLEAVQRDRPVYWLGRTFDPGNGLPVLTLERAADLRANGERSSVMLEYAGNGAHINVEIWTAAAWDSYWNHVRGATPFGSQCAHRSVAGEAIIWMSYFSEAAKLSGQVTIVPAGTTPVLPTPGPFPTPTPHACPEGTFETYMTVAEMPGGDVVTINAPIALERPPNEKPGAFDSLPAMTSVASALHERQPGE